MVKSFKKAIACMLAILMVAFSVPFTALAAFNPTDPSSMHPDLELQFGAFYNMSEGFDTPSSTSATIKDATYGYSGLYGPPVIATYTKDTTTGGISITKLEQKASLSGDAAAQCAAWNYEDGNPSDSWTCQPIDKVYAQDDYFTLTVRLDNVTAARFASFAVAHSNNIALAAAYHTGSGSRAKYFLGTADQAASGTVDFGGENQLQDQSGEAYGWPCFDDEKDFSNNIMRITYSSGEYKTGSGMASVDQDGMTFIDPVTGEDNYTYTNTCVVCTFLFKITGQFDATHPITFAPADPTNQMYTQSYEGGSFSTLVPEQPNMATYAPLAIAGGDQQFTFFGMNINSGEGTGGGGETHTHTMTPYAANAATCTTAGNSAYWYCADCGKYFSDAEGNTEIAADSWVIPATGHTPAAAVTENNVNPTCTVGGSYDSVVYCSVCNAELSRETINVPANGHSYGSVVTAPTCTEPGFTTYTCSVCGDSYTGDEVAATGHNWGEWTEVSPEVPATEESTGTTAVEQRVCANDPTHVETRGGEEIPVLPHTHVAGEAAQENVVPATCTEAGSYDLVVRCTKCNEIMESTPQTIPATGHAWGEWTVTTAAVAPTCTEAGATAIETRVCANDSTHVETRGGEEVPATGHTMQGWTVTTPAVAATCTEDGAEAIETNSCANCDYKETRGGAVIPATGHTWGEWTVTKEATINEEGSKTRECSVCHETETEAIPTADIEITVANVDGGSVTGDIASGETKTYKFGASYSITAEAAAGYAFKGWKINGKSVSTATTYSSKAFNNLTIEPIFAKTEAESFTVIFYDLYKTVVKTQTVSSAAEIEAPTDAQMARQGYTFDGWDKDLTAITSSTEVTGKYSQDKNILYTVTVTGSDAATINGEDVTTMDVAYDTKVTVSAEGAKAWKIGETVVATGSTYSFYVGSDVTVEAVFADADLEPTIVMVGVEQIGTSYRRLFVASRVVPEGYTVEKVGFIYGKNLADDELVLEKVGDTGKNTGAGVVKVGYNTVNSVNETTLQYGISGQSGVAKARAFMIVSKGKEKSVLYSGIGSYDYDTGTTNIQTISGIDD